MNKGLEHSGCWVFGSQESVGELNGFVEIIVFVNCCTEMQRALSHKLPCLWILTCQTSYPSKSHSVRDFWACSESLAVQQLQQNVSVFHNPTQVVLRWLSANDKLLSEHKRKYIDPFYLHFVVSVIWVIHKSLRHCLSLWRQSAHIVSAFANRQSHQNKREFMRFSVILTSCFVKKRVLCCIFYLTYKKRVWVVKI